MRQTKTLPRPCFVGLYPGSSQVAVSPCWELALPDVISTVCVQALGPIPRRVRPVHLPVSSRTTSASPHEGQVRHANIPPALQLLTGERFSGLQSFANVQAPQLARPPGCTHRWHLPGRPGLLHHAGPASLPNTGSGIATYPTRAIGTAGLAPARLYSCRLLSPSLALRASVDIGTLYR